LRQSSKRPRSGPARFPSAALFFTSHDFMQEGSLGHPLSLTLKSLKIRPLSLDNKFTNLRGSGTITGNFGKQSAWYYDNRSICALLGAGADVMALALSVPYRLKGQRFLCALDAMEMRRRTLGMLCSP
jgi:hypothetical protein